MKKNVILSVLFILVMIIFVSCDKDEPAPSFDFKVVSVVPENYSTGVSIESNVVITFNKPVTSIKYLFGANYSLDPTEMMFSEDRKVITIDLIGPMKNNTLYSLAMREVISEEGDTLKMFTSDNLHVPLMQIEFTTEI